MSSQQVSRRLTAVLLLLVVLGATCVPAVHAQSSFGLALTPGSGAPGAELRLTGYGFGPDTAYDVHLIGPNGFRMVLDRVLTTAAGSIPPTPLVVPGIAAPGDYVVAVQLTRITYARAPLQIRPAPTITLDSAEGVSGDRIGVRVDGLAAGTLQVHYAGAVVLGPLDVGEGGYEGSFIIPPGSQERGVMVEALNMVDGARAGYARVDFAERQAPDTPRELREVVLPDAPLAPGQNFMVSGLIEPAPSAASLPGYQLQALWRPLDGPGVPINTSLATLNADGSFEIGLRAPSLMKGDPLTSRPGDRLELSLVSPIGEVIRWGTDVAVRLPDPMQFEAVKDMPGTEEDGLPIPNTPKVAGQPDALRVAIAPVGSPFLLQRDDLTNMDKAQPWLDIADLWESPQDQQIKKAADKISNCWGRKFTSKIPEYEWYFYEWAGLPEEAIFARPTEMALVELPAYAQAPVAGVQRHAGPASLAQALEKVGPDQVVARVFQVLVDASRVVDGAQQGYTFGKDDNIAKPYIGLYVYIPELNLLFEIKDAWGHDVRPVAMPVQIRMRPLPPGWTTELKAGKLVAYAPEQQKIEGRIYSFVDRFMGPFLPGVNVQVQPGHDTIDLRAYPVKSATGGAPTTRFSIKYAGDDTAIDLGPGFAGVEPASDGDCGSPGNPARDYYAVPIPNADRLPPGDHVLTFTISDGVKSLSTQLTLSYVAPPDWIKDPVYLNRAAQWSLHKVWLSATRYDESNATVTMDRAQLDVISDRPDNGVDNGAGGNLTVTQNLGPTGVGSIMTDGKTRSQTINAAKDVPAAKPHSTGATISFGTKDQFISLLDTSWIPVYHDVWGVPPIASASFDLRTRVIASLKYNGTVKTDGQGAIGDVALEVHPKAEVLVDAGLDASALGELVEAGVHALPRIGVGLPIVFKNGGIDKFGACLYWELKLRIYGSVGWEPAEVGFDTTQTILPPDELCLDLAAARVAHAQAAQAEQDWKLPGARPAVATDGFGRVLMLWRAESGELVYQLGLDGAPLPLPGARLGALKPQVAFFGPNQAVAVWAESALEPEQAPGISFEDAVKLQHLVYAVWNGAEWEAPQRLTEPTTGDGNVTLAGCMPQRDSRCPAGGAVTAIWTHDEAGDLAARNFRIYGATFDGATWQWEQRGPVDDGESSSGQPTVVYSLGRPLAAWVRDADYDVGTLADRGLALRYLDLPDIQLPPALQGRVGAPALARTPDERLALTYVVHDTDAIISNQTSLHVATCGDPASCEWEARQLTDQLGRAIYAERPVPTVDDQGRLAVTYRSLGGATAPGQKATLASGPIAQVEVDPAAPYVTPAYLTGADALYTQPAAVYDPLANRIVTLAARGALPPGSIVQGPTALRSALLFDEPGLVIGSAPRGPDFEVVAARLPEGQPLDGQPLSVDVRVGNLGTRWAGAEPLELVATWEDGLQVAEAGRATIPGLEAGEVLDLQLSVSPPPAGFARAQRLVVAVNPAQHVREQSALNNRRELAVGALPVVGDLGAGLEAGSPLVFLHWTPLDDPRVAGYRVYRLDEGGGRSAVGSSLGDGWVDTDVALEVPQRYAVASYTADGVEGPLSAPLTVVVPASVPPTETAAVQRFYLPLLDNNEVVEE